MGESASRMDAKGVFCGFGGVKIPPKNGGTPYYIYAREADNVYFMDFLAEKWGKKCVCASYAWDVWDGVCVPGDDVCRCDDPAVIRRVRWLFGGCHSSRMSPMTRATACISETGSSNGVYSGLSETMETCSLSDPGLMRLTRAPCAVSRT